MKFSRKHPLPLVNHDGVRLFPSANKEYIRPLELIILRVLCSVLDHRNDMSVQLNAPTCNALAKRSTFSAPTTQSLSSSLSSASSRVVYTKTKTRNEQHRPCTRFRVGRGSSHGERKRENRVKRPLRVAVRDCYDYLFMEYAVSNRECDKSDRFKVLVALT